MSNSRKKTSDVVNVLLKKGAFDHASELAAATSASLKFCHLF